MRLRKVGVQNLFSHQSDWGPLIPDDQSDEEGYGFEGHPDRRSD
jgi:hypothetical protein